MTPAICSTSANMPATSSRSTNVPGATGVSWGEALAMITSRPAEALGLGREIGSLAPGRRADVVIWSGRPVGGQQQRRDGVDRRGAAAAGHQADQASRPLQGLVARRASGGLSAVTPQAGLVLVGHRLRRHAFPAVASAARAASSASWASGPFQGLYSLVALPTFGLDDLVLRGDRARAAAVGSRARRAGSPRPADVARLDPVRRLVPRQSGASRRPSRGAKRRPSGVFAITRHPMMWGFALWAIVHLLVVGTPKAMVFDGAILFLALAGSVGQDRKKAKLMGERLHEWTAQTAFLPFAAASHGPGRSRSSAEPCCSSSRPGCIRCRSASGAGSADHSRCGAAALKPRAMTRKFFGTDGIRGLTNSEPMTAETALRVGQAAGAHFLRGDHRHRVVIGKDTRLSRLHDGIGDGRRLHIGRHGRRPAGADADAGGGDADAVDARRPRRDDLRLAQSVRRQWHQAVRPGRLQAQRQGRAGDRAAAREGRRSWPRPSKIGRARRIDDARGRYIHTSSRPFPSGCGSTG